MQARFRWWLSGISPNQSRASAPAGLLGVQTTILTSALARPSFKIRSDFTEAWCGLAVKSRKGKGGNARALRFVAVCRSLPQEIIRPSPISAPTCPYDHIQHASCAASSPASITSAVPSPCARTTSQPFSIGGEIFRRLRLPVGCINL